MAQYDESYASSDDDSAYEPVSQEMSLGEPMKGEPAPADPSLGHPGAPAPKGLVTVTLHPTISGTAEQWRRGIRVPVSYKAFSKDISGMDHGYSHIDAVAVDGAIKPGPGRLPFKVAYTVPGFAKDHYAVGAHSSAVVHHGEEEHVMTAAPIVEGILSADPDRPDMKTAKADKKGKYRVVPVGSPILAWTAAKKPHVMERADIRSNADPVVLPTKTVGQAITELGEKHPQTNYVNLKKFYVEARMADNQFVPKEPVGAGLDGSSRASKALYTANPAISLTYFAGNGMVPASETF